MFLLSFGDLSVVSRRFENSFYTCFVFCACAFTGRMFSGNYFLVAPGGRCNCSLSTGPAM